jgi:hypothetical protein
LVLLGVNAFDLCWLRRFLGILLYVAYHNYARMRHAARFKLGLNRNQNSNEMKLISNYFTL